MDIYFRIISKQDHGRISVRINGMKPHGKPWTPVPPQRGGVFTIVTPRSDAVNVITHSRAPLSSQINQGRRSSSNIFFQF